MTTIGELRNRDHLERAERNADVRLMAAVAHPEWCADWLDPDQFDDWKRKKVCRLLLEEPSLDRVVARLDSGTAEGEVAFWYFEWLRAAAAENADQMTKPWVDEYLRPRAWGKPSDGSRPKDGS